MTSKPDIVKSVFLLSFSSVMMFFKLYCLKPDMENEYNCNESLMFLLKNCSSI